MINKSSCPSCGKKVSKKDNFCPSCGKTLQDPAREKKEWGLLGKNDKTPSNIKQGGGILDKMIEGMMKMLEKEMQKDLQKNSQKSSGSFPQDISGGIPTNFKLMINGKEIDLGNKKSQENTRNQKKELTQKELPSNRLKDFAKNQKKEPSTSVKRFADKIVYEINLPGVESQKELSITKLENSIEIKAKSKDSSYFKIVPLNYPIIGYNFESGKLSLEFSE